MSLSALLVQAFPNQSEKIVDWERLNFDLQVALSWCDGEVSPDERVGLLMRSPMLSQHEDLEGRMDMWGNLIRSQGLEDVAGQIFSHFHQLQTQLPSTLRSQVIEALLLEVISTVIADKVISPAERNFIFDHVAPGLRLAPSRAEALLEDAIQTLQNAMRFAAYGFELYLMMWDQAEDTPPATHLPDGLKEPYPTAVRELTVAHALGSATAVSYFLSVFGGVGIVTDYQRYCKELADYAPIARQHHGSPDASQQRLEEIMSQLRADPVNAAAAVDEVFNHLVQIFSQVAGLTPGFLKVFRAKVLPAFGVDFDAMVQQAHAMKDINPTLLTNLTLPGSEPDAPRKTWWAFWK